MGAPRPPTAMRVPNLSPPRHRLTSTREPRASAKLTSAVLKVGEFIRDVNSKEENHKTKAHENQDPMHGVTQGSWSTRFGTDSGARAQSISPQRISCRSSRLPGHRDEARELYTSFASQRPQTLARGQSATLANNPRAATCTMQWSPQCPHPTGRRKKHHKSQDIYVESLYECPRMFISIPVPSVGYFFLFALVP